QLPCARSFDIQVLVDDQLAVVAIRGRVGRQVDGLAVQALIEDDGIAALGGGDRVPERAGAEAGVVGDGQGAGHDAVVEGFELRAEGQALSGHHGRSPWLWGRLCDVTYERDVCAAALRQLVASLQPLPLVMDTAAWCRIHNAWEAADRRLPRWAAPIL